MLFRQVIDLDPNFAGGYRGLAWALVVGGTRFRLYAEALQAVEMNARRAVAPDGADAEARACLSGALLQGHADYQGAQTEAERVLAISPNLASAHGKLGRTLIFSGLPGEGLASVEMSIRLDPRDPLMALRLNQLPVGHYVCGAYLAAAEAARQAIRTFPEHPLPYRWLAASLGQAGQAAEAKEALERAIAVAPSTFDLFVRQRVRWHRPEDYTRTLEGLRLAGWDG